MTQRILIFDPEPFFGEALATALEDAAGIRVVGWTSEEHEADALVASLAPDVVLAGIDGIPEMVSRWVRRVDGRARTVVLTRSPVGESLLEAAVAGASGVLSHELGIQELIGLLLESSDGRFIVDSKRLAESLQDAARGHNHATLGSNLIDRLTDRERQVLYLLADGLNNAAIGKRLNVSAHTIRTHVGSILRKLEVHSRAQAARLALSDGDHADVLHIRGPDLHARRTTTS
jgi:DNA-binding NarL/FixJ family response regulator